MRLYRGRVCVVVCIGFALLCILLYKLPLPGMCLARRWPSRPLSLDQKRLKVSCPHMDEMRVVSHTTPDPCDPHPLSVLMHDPHPVFESNMAYLESYLENRSLLLQDRAAIRRERPDPVELYLFRQPPTTHSRCLPEERNSTVHVINPRDQYRVGDTVQVRVDLHTGYGTPRQFGGDDVRIWLKSDTGRSSVVAKVTDLNNGSYLGEAVLKWPGVTLVRVSLTHPQEYLRALSELLHTIYNLRWNTDFFDNRKGTQEKTLCAPFAPIPGFPKICNLTSRNGDRSWFCSHPVSKGLNCSHWSTSNNLGYLSVDKAPIASVVRPFIAKLKQCCKDPTLTLRLIPKNVTIFVREGGDQQPPVVPPCWSRPRRVTWQSSAHTGWLNQGAWLSDTCSLPPLTRQFITKCMRNTTLVLLGDSNQRLWWDTIHGYLPCTSLKQAGKWHAPRLCQNRNLGSTLLFLSHSMPFSMGTHSDLVTVPLPRALDRLLQHAILGGQAVLVLHYYRHFATYSVQVYRQRVREARQTLEQFVQLHPEVTVIIRGSHASYQSHVEPTTMIGDAGVTSYAKVWREEFRGLEDQILYLDFWDLTVAAENVRIHPEPQVTREMLKVFFGHMCKEKG